AKCLLGFMQGRFGSLALRDVTDDACKKDAFARPPACQRQLQREFSPVFSSSGQLDCRSHDVSFSGLEMSLEALLMGVLEPFGYDQREALPAGFGERVAEHSLGAAVPMDDVALLVGRNDGVLSGLCQCPVSFFAGAQR